VIANYSFDRALAAIIDLVMERATERTTRGSAADERAVAAQTVHASQGGRP
jgi:hypothetical protein